MLEKLDQIDWASIHHSHGTAEQFPTWIRALLIDDDTVWSDDQRSQSAYSYLRELSNHQGTIYPVTPIVTPFILELLPIVPAKRKEQLLGILVGYSWGCRFVNKPQDKPDWRTEISWEQENRNVEEARVVLSLGIPLFVSYLNGEDVRLRMAAVELLLNMTKWNDQNAAQVQPILAARLRIETDSQVKAYIDQLWAREREYE